MMEDDGYPYRIAFEKPDLNQLRREGAMVDLHFHSRHSDGINKVAAIARRAEKLGIGLAITDHNAIGGALELDAYDHILSIPGIEVTSREGTHVLIYFYDTRSLRHFYLGDVAPNMGHEIMSSISLSLAEIIERARAFDTVIIFPHPFCGGYMGVCNHHFPGERLQQLLQMADGVEVINAENLNRWNMRSALLGFNLGKIVTGGSDGHTLGQMGKVVTCARCGWNRRDFLDALRHGRNRVVGKEAPMLRKVTSNSVKLRSSIKNYPNIVEKNLRYSYAVINTKSRTFRDRVKRGIIDARLRRRGAEAPVPDWPEWRE